MYGEFDELSEFYCPHCRWEGSSYDLVALDDEEVDADFLFCPKCRTQAVPITQ